MGKMPGILGDMEYMDVLDQILPLVKKPARYAGGEWNAIHKEWSDVDLRVAFAFPDV